MSATDRLPLVKQDFTSGPSDIFDKERDMLGRSASGGFADVGKKYEIGTSNPREWFIEALLRPLADMSYPDTHHFASIGHSDCPRLVAHGKREDGDEKHTRLRWRPNLPSTTQLGRLLDAGGPQSSSSQTLSADSSFRQGKAAPGRFQHHKGLASLTGVVPHGSHGNMVSFSKDVGDIFGAAEEDEDAGCDNDIVAEKDEDDGDDADWETLRGSGLKANTPTKSYTNREETATSLANVSSYGSLTGNVPANAWSPVAGRARVLANRSKAVLPCQSRIGTGAKTGVSGMSPEFEPSNGRYEYGEIEMTGRMRPRSLERPFLAFTTTNQHSATPNQQVNTTYRHPEPMSEEHRHPFSLTPPVIVPIDDLTKTHPIKSGITGDEVLGGAEDIEEDGSQMGLVMSKMSNTQHFPASTVGKGLPSYLRDTREPSSPSDLSIDDSCSESCRSGPALSTSSIIYESQNLPQPTGTFSKCTILGPKGNITGSFDGTGMRAVGSSEADCSTDSVMIKSHKYERLDDERTLEQAQPSTTTKTAAQSAPKGLKKVIFVKASETQITASVTVLTKIRPSISAPTKFEIPTT